MAVHEELKPVDGVLPFLLARDNRVMATDNGSRTPGVIAIPNADGVTETVLGANGVAPWVGDTVAPGKPVGVNATCRLQTVLVRWDGELEGGVPDDFRCVRLYAQSGEDDPVLVGELSSAGELATGVFEPGSRVTVWAVALDDAHDEFGMPAYNVSEPSERVTVDVLAIVSQQEFDEAAQGILDAAAEDAGKQVAKVDAALQDASDRIDANKQAVDEALVEVDKTLEAQGTVLTRVDADVTQAKQELLAQAERMDGVETQVGQAQDAASRAESTANAAKSTADGTATVVSQVKGDVDRVKADTIVGSVIEYAVGGASTAPSSGWTTGGVTRPAGATVWMRTRVTYGDGRTSVSSAVPVTGDTGAKGDPGKDGAPGKDGVPGEPGADGLPGAPGVDGRTSYVHLAYADNATGTQGFSTTDSDKPYIGCYTDFTQADSTDPSKYAWSKIKGEQGVQGLKGDPGADGLPGVPGVDGRTSYVHFAYADSMDGRTGFSTSNGVNKAYIGQYVDFTQADSTDPSKYTWTLIKGAQGVKGDKGEDGAAGSPGVPGVSVVALTTYYQLSLSKPAQPTALNPGTGWGVSEPEYDQAKTLYTVTRVEYSDNSWAWMPVQTSSAYRASQAAETAARDAVRTATNAETTAATAKRTADEAKTGATNASSMAQGAQATATQANATANSAMQTATSAQTSANILMQQAEELLPNGGFELGERYWRTNVTDAGFVQESTSARSGAYRAYTNISQRTSELTSLFMVEATTGRRYRASCWYKIIAKGSASVGGLRVQYSTDGESWTDCPDCPSFDWTGDANTWHELSVDVVASERMRFLRVRIVADAPFDSYVDDVSVKDITLAYQAQTAADKAQSDADEARTFAANADAKAVAAQATALGAQTTADSKSMVFVQVTDPMLAEDTARLVKPGDLWWQLSGQAASVRWLGDADDSMSVLLAHDGEIEHMWVWNGSRWHSHTLYAQDLLVNGSIVAELIAVDAIEARHIRVGAIEADKLAATALYGKIIKGGVFLTANERLVLNDTGMLVKDPQGETTLAVLADTGEIILKGAVQSGGEISGTTITSATIQTSSDANRGLKLTSGGMVAYDATGKPTFTLKDDGSILMDGGVMSNASLTAATLIGGMVTGATLQTYADASKGVKISGSRFCAYSDDGELMLMLEGETGDALLTGGMRTAASGKRLEIHNDVYDDPSSGKPATQGVVKGYDDVGELWHIVGTSTRQYAADGMLDPGWSAQLSMGIDPQQPEIMIRRYGLFQGTGMTLHASRLDIVSTGDFGPYGEGVYVNNRRIDNQPSLYHARIDKGNVAANGNLNFTYVWPTPFSENVSVMMSSESSAPSYCSYYNPGKESIGVTWKNPNSGAARAIVRFLIMTGVELLV